MIGECLIFEYMNSLWGPFEVDWFASDSNHKLKLFYPRYWNVKCFGIDAFTGIWSNKNGWLCPPIYLVARVLAKIKKDKAFGCLIIPMWKSANCWPILCLNGDKFCDCVKNVVYLPSDKQFS